MTIPELRRSFEHIETFVHQHKRSKDLVKMLQEEWLKVFKKKLDKESASAFVNHTIKESGGQSGGGSQLTGAPLDYTTRPGLYISPGINQGSYAQVPNYVSSGFWNPEPGQSYDRVIGQTVYPDRTPAGLGDNTVIGLKMAGGSSSGRRTKKNMRKQAGGDPVRTIGTALNQFLFRPIQSTIPPSIPQDALTAAKGESLGPSPLSYQNKLDYQMGPRLHSGNLQISPIEAKLPINIKNP